MIRDDNFGAASTRVSLATLTNRVVSALRVALPFNINGRMLQLKAVQHHMVPATAAAMGIHDSSGLPAKDVVMICPTSNRSCVYAINVEDTLLLLVALDVSVEEANAIGLELDKRLKAFYAA